MVGVRQVYGLNLLELKMMKNNLHFNKTKDFTIFFITWVANNLSVPFWVVGHVHLTMNIYQDIHEIIVSFGMNILVLIGFWIEWKRTV